MTSGQILALSFLVFSIFVLVFLFFFSKKRKSGLKRPFLLASCGVYLSGNLLVFVMSLLRENLSMIIALLCDLAVLFVFVTFTFLMSFMSKKLEETAQEAKDNNLKK